MVAFVPSPRFLEEELDSEEEEENLPKSYLAGWLFLAERGMGEEDDGAAGGEGKAGQGRYGTGRVDRDARTRMAGHATQSPRMK